MRKFLIVSIGLLLNLLAVYFVLNSKGCKADRSISVSDTSRTEVITQQFDSTEVRIVRDTIPIKDSIFVATNTPVDTAEVVRRYLTSYFYQDTFRNSDLSMIVSDSLYNNRLTYRAYQYKILRPDSVITRETTIRLPVKLPVIYAGLGIAFSNGKTSIIPKMAYSHPKGFLVESGLIFQNYSPGIYAGFSIKIK